MPPPTRPDAAAVPARRRWRPTRLVRVPRPSATPAPWWPPPCPCRPRCGRCRRTSGSPWSCVTCTGSGTRRPPRSSGSRSGPSRAGSSAGGSRSGSGSPSGTTVGEPRRPSQRPNQRKRNVTTTRSSPSVPVHPTHPDPEELAAWQAGDLSGPGDARVEAHVSGCRDCAGLLAAVERGRAALAGLAELAEVEPPASLHERLAAAIGDGLGESASISEPIPLDGRRRGRRSPGGRRRIAVLSTAAALILLVVGLVPLLRHGGGQTMATQGAGRGAGSASRALGGSAEGT